MKNVIIWFTVNILEIFFLYVWLSYDTFWARNLFYLSALFHFCVGLLVLTSLILNEAGMAAEYKKINTKGFRIRVNIGRVIDWLLFLCLVAFGHWIAAFLILVGNTSLAFCHYYLKNEDLLS